MYHYIVYGEESEYYYRQNTWKRASFCAFMYITEKHANLISLFSCSLFPPKVMSVTVNYLLTAYVTARSWNTVVLFSIACRVTV